MNHNIQRMKDKYDPDGGDIAVGPHGQWVYVSWADFTLLEIIEAQQAQIDVLRIEHQSEINSLKAQVAKLQEAGPMGAPPRGDGSNRGRNKLFKD